MVSLVVKVVAAVAAPMSVLVTKGKQRSTMDAAATCSHRWWG
jgi:hypothetical protein